MKLIIDPQLVTTQVPLTGNNIFTKRHEQFTEICLI